MEEIGEQGSMQTNLFSSATAAKLILVGMALATGVAIGVGTTSMYYQNIMSMSAISPTPLPTSIVSPTPTSTQNVSTYPSPLPSIAPTNFYTQEFACTTIADCYKARPCDQKTLDMYGNGSHCAIASCESGICNWKLVP